MAKGLTGGCACGAVRYECNADPVLVVHCCCRDCQRTSGAQMSTNAVVPDGAFKVTAGETRTFETRGDSGGTVVRHFCPTCGSNLFSRPTALAGMVVVKVGTLDDPAGVVPGMTIFTRSAPPWAVLPQDLPAFPGMPPA